MALSLPFVPYGFLELLLCFLLSFPLVSYRRPSSGLLLVIVTSAALSSLSALAILVCLQFLLGMLVFSFHVFPWHLVLRFVGFCIIYVRFVTAVSSALFLGLSLLKERVPSSINRSSMVLPLGGLADVFVLFMSLFSWCLCEICVTISIRRVSLICVTVMFLSLFF